MSSKKAPTIYLPGALVWLVDNNKKFAGVILSRDCLLRYTVQIAVKGVGGTAVRHTVYDVVGSRLEGRVA